MSKLPVSIGASLLLLTGAVAQAHAEDRHYMLMFASQGESNLPQDSHTFAVFVKAPKGDNGKEAAIESHCISWMPKTLEIELLRVNPVTGKNLNLRDTLRWARRTNARVTMWGPFLIKEELYNMAVEQAERLNANAIEYIVLDNRRRVKTASNCIHAVSDLDTTVAPLVTGTAFGELASQMVLRHFERFIIPSTEDTRWLCDRLQLNADAVRFVTLDKKTEAAPDKTEASRLPKGR